MIKSALKTIRLNGGYWHKKIPFFKYVVSDPLKVFSKDAIEFSDAMTSFKLSGVFKSTKADRHHETQKFLKQYISGLDKTPVLLDIGASDGTTSLQLIEMVDTYFEKYYVTDYNIRCNYIIQNGFTYFFNQSADCFLIASNKFVFYPENKKLFNFLFKRKIVKLNNKTKTELLLCNHHLKSKAETNKNIIIMDYNIFEPWTMEKPDIIIVGNLLNTIYFSKDEIYKALLNCYNTICDNGVLTIIRNSKLSKGSEIELAVVYKKNAALKSFEQIFQINGGVEINEFVLSSKF